MSYVTGKTIRELREKKQLTQKQLAGLLQISDKTVSKWETDRGLPDIGFIEKLAETLGVSLTELLLGEVICNENKSANMKKTAFYVCPVCGNVIQSIGQGSFHCCGILLPVAEAEEADEQHQVLVERVENDYYVHMEHPMTKEHYISFVAYVTSSKTEFIKMYPEQSIECRFAKRERGYLYYYCNRHGLFRMNI